MKRKYNLSLIKKKHCYTFEEIAELFYLHCDTPLTWRRRGLKVVDEHIRPYLILGSDLYNFLEKEKLKRSKKMNHGEFYCTTCQSIRRSVDNKIVLEISDIKLGKDTYKAQIKGICPVCGRNLLLFSSLRQILNLLDTGIIILENEKKPNSDQMVILAHEELLCNTLPSSYKASFVNMSNGGKK